MGWMSTVASTTIGMLWNRIVVGGGVAEMASAGVRSSLIEDTLKMVAPRWCFAWGLSARQLMRAAAQPTVGVRCWVRDASVK